MTKKLIALVLVICLALGTMSVLSSCGNNGGGNGGKGADAFVIMTDALDGVFNPFYSTTAADGTIVAMTQIGMITTGYVNGEVDIAYGDDEAVVVKDLMQSYDDVNDVTTYTFIIKNGIKYSDGHPLTIEDVLFNMYVYLDPVYTGSSTMYSTDIIGLADYRSQQYGADSDVDEIIAEAARYAAQNRINELINLFKASDTGANKNDTSYEVDYNTMIAAINAHSLSDGYREAISNNPASVTNAQLKADYELALKLFREELESDYVSAQEAFTEAPYKGHSEFENEVFCFMYYEGFITPEYGKDADGKEDRNNIIGFKNNNYSQNVMGSKESAIEYVYNSKINSELHIILSYWATANELMTDYTAKAREVLLNANITDGVCPNEDCGHENAEGTKYCTQCGHSLLNVQTISGITSLGHNTDIAEVVIGGKTYKVAHTHNADGTPANADEYDVLQIKINGVDPKAIWNFAFSVAPQHYYAEGYKVDIAKNNFGVVQGSFDFMTNSIKSQRNIKLPMGAGAYKVTNQQNSDNPAQGEFFTNNVAYFKANNYFETVGNVNNAKIEKVRYQVVSASNALNALETSQVHYITPQLTNDNLKKLDNLKSKGITYTYTDQLGYGYIGINAGKVQDINLRRAIMTAMNTSLALSYYKSGTASQIYWPMSKVSWAYPKDRNGNEIKDNGHDYPPLGQFDEAAAKETILELMDAAGVSAGDSKLKLKFTIAGSDLTDHPTYLTFESAANLLNDLGWDIEVIADSNALIKLSTGSLAVWAAAWGSTVDPDLYQVYHKNSTATSVLAWGYREILANPGIYEEENQILNALSEKIDEARMYTDKATRSALYMEAMDLILDLAIELPVYQRSVLYAYNTNVIDVNSLPSANELNPYTSPLDKIWEIEFAK